MEKKLSDYKECIAALEDEKNEVREEEKILRKQNTKEKTFF